MGKIRILFCNDNKIAFQDEDLYYPPNKEDGTVDPIKILDDLSSGRKKIKMEATRCNINVTKKYTSMTSVDYFIE